MKSKEAGSPAYPQQMYFRDGSPKVPEGADRGMTLRDFFAAQALAGICAHPDNWGRASVIDLAEMAFVVADAMLDQRAKPLTGQANEDLK